MHSIYGLIITCDWNRYIKKYNFNLDVLDLCQDVCARPLEPLWTTELNCLTLSAVNTLTLLINCAVLQFSSTSWWVSEVCLIIFPPAESELCLVLAAGTKMWSVHVGALWSSIAFSQQFLLWNTLTNNDTTDCLVINPEFKLKDWWLWCRWNRLTLLRQLLG